ncbi:aspartate dehydrogenase [Novosphingobium rosa]|uniref:aspartate dehydrogenase n=1 Tax=Novosphingobium rosa TaxID=76978 RepID=UPI00082B608B|nr:aspartate dehydrogenase [Novosphingobium rosa]
MLRIGFIGNGSIARAACAALGPDVTLCGHLARPGRSDGDLAVERLADLLDRQPDVVVECAGHEAVREHGAAVLEAGVALMVVSIGALADPALESALNDAATRSGARLILPAGAVGGIDALTAAKLGGLSSVTYRARKPAMAWAGSPAEKVVDLASLGEATTFFRGTAREAAIAFPKNSNVAATVALAGVGFDATQVELVADPHSSRNLHEICFEGADGAFRFEIEGRPSPDNPKTSLLTAHSVARELLTFAAQRKAR